MSLQYIGLDVHKKWIVYCVKNAEGKILEESRIRSTPEDVREWCRKRTVAWKGLMEATMFSGWIHDEMVNYAEELRVGHPDRMKLLLPAKNKSDRDDARRFADLCRCNAIRTSEVMPAELRRLRTNLRFRNQLKRQRVQLKNRIASLLMESGIYFDARKVYSKKQYEKLQDLGMADELKPVLRTCQSQIETLGAIQKALLKGLQKAPPIRERVKRLQTIPGVGLILALTWALEIGRVERFSSAGDAMSYCGLVTAKNESAGKDRGGPLSKKRNHWLQTMLIEVAHLAPRYNWLLEQVRERESRRNKPNVAAIAVARKLVAYLLAVDRSGKDFQMPPRPETATVSGGEIELPKPHGACEIASMPPAAGQNRIAKPSSPSGGRVRSEAS